MSVGEVLAQARHRAGLGVAQVSQLTRIGESIITRIEGDDFSACGGDWWARGDIRSIARAVGADPEPLIAMYDDAARLGPEPAGKLTERPPQVPERRRPAPVAATRSPQERPPAGPVMPRQTPRRPPPGQPVTPAGQHRHRRRWPVWTVALGVVVAGLGFAGYLLVGPRGEPSAGAHLASSHRPSHAPSAAATATGSAPATPAPAAATAARPLTPASAAAFGGAGGPGDNGSLAPMAIDGNPTTAWQTDWYTTAQFGGLYPGTGLLVDMGRPVTITSARIILGRARGASFQLRIGSAPALAELHPVAQAAGAGGVVRLRLTSPAHGRYVLLWFTSLPPGPAGFQAQVYGIQLRGQA